MAVSSVTDHDFNDEVLNSNQLVLVDFWAEWCNPCLALAPKLEEISEEMGDKLKILKINVDKNSEVASKYGVTSIPTLILFKKGEKVNQTMGNQSKEALLSFVNSST